jgi:hypothetical protein
VQMGAGARSFANAGSSETVPSLLLRFGAEAVCCSCAIMSNSLASELP